MPDATIIGKVAIKVIPETTTFRREAQRALDRIEKQLDPLKVKLDLAAGSKKKIQAELKALTHRRTVTIAPKIDNAAFTKVAATLSALSGGRGISNIGRDIADWAGNLDKQIPKIAAVSLAISNLASASLVSSANILSLGSSLASTVGSALALPGIFGGMAIGLGASYAVLKDFNNRLPEVADKLHALQDRMSAKFWSQAEQPIRNLVNSLLPQFSRGLEDTSTSLGRFFARLAESGTDVFNGELQSMFDDLNRSIDISTRHTKVFTDIIARLGSVGAGNLPRLARWFGDISTKFDDFLKRKGETGLQKLVDEGVAALKDLGGVISATADLFSGLADAAQATGASTLATLRRTMESAAATVHRPKFQNALRDAFQGARDGLDNLTDESGKQFEDFMVRLTTTLAETLPVAGRTAGKALGAIFAALDQPVVQKTVLGFFDDLETMVDTLAPTLPNVARGLSAVVETVGKIGTNVASGLAPLLDALGSSLPGLADDFDPLITQLGKLVENASEMAAGVLPELLSALGSTAGAVAKVLTPVNAFIDLLQQMPGPIKDILGKITALGLLVGGSVWLGAAVRAKIGLFGGAMTKAGVQTIFASGAFFKAGSMAQAATSRMTAARFGILGLGVAALSMRGDAAKANGALGELTSVAGAAAVGFAVGGPLGAALGATAGALLGVKDSSDAVNQSLADIDTVIATGSLEEMRQKAAEVDEQLRRLDHTNDGFIRSLVNLVSPAQGAKAAFEQLFGRDKLQAGADALAYAMTHVDGAAFLMGETIGLTADEMLAGASAADKMSTSLARLNGYFDKRAAVRSYKDSIAELSKGLRNGFTRSDAVNLDNLGRSIVQVADTLEKNPKKQQNFLNSAREQLEGLAKTSTPRAKAAIDKLIAQLDSKALTEPKPIKLTADDKRLQATTARVTQDLTILGRSIVEPKIGANDSPFKAIYGDVKRSMSNMDILLATPKVALDPGNSISLLQQIQNMLNGLHSKTINVTVNRLGGGSVTSSAGGHSALPADESGRRAGYEAAHEFSEAFAQTLEKMQARVSSAYEKLLDKAGKKGAKKVKAAFAGELDKLNELAKQHRRLMSQLAEAQSVLEGYQAQWTSLHDTVRDTIVGQSDITQLGAKTYSGLVRGLNKAKEKALAFTQVIKDLMASGLNKTTLQQILNAGPEAGLAIAQAILAGGVQQINEIQAQIDAAAEAAGTAAGQHFFGDLVTQAQSDVDKLIQQLGPLQARLERFAHDLIESLSKALKKEWASQMEGDTGGGKGGKGGKGSKGGKGGKSKPYSAVHNLANAGLGPGVNIEKQVIYNAAPGRSISSEEDLFEALGK